MRVPNLVLLAGASVLAAPAVAQVYVAPHVTRDGTFVQGHHRTAPNESRTDNWSSRPNVNPYNGKVGTIDPYSPPAPARARANPYSSKKSCASVYGC